MKWMCQCHLCDRWFESEYEDDNLCPECHGEWMTAMAEENSREPPEDFLLEEEK